MSHLIISQNLANSRLKFPKDTVLRVNLAWHKNLSSLSAMLKKHKGHDIFIDIPVGRKKPPNHNHDIIDIANIVRRFSNVKYVGISNVENPSDLCIYNQIFKCKIVPKIETYKGVKNIIAIIGVLNYTPRVLMLDHEDLFANLVLLKKEKHYLQIINSLMKTCKKNNTHLLRVKGIIFSNE